MPVSTQRVNKSAINRRRAVGISASDRNRPQLAAAVHVERDQLATGLAFAHREDATVRDRDRRVSSSKPIDLPFQFRTVVGPFGLQPGFFHGNTAAVRSTPRGPVIGGCQLNLLQSQH